MDNLLLQMVLYTEVIGKITVCMVTELCCTLLQKLLIKDNGEQINITEKVHSFFKIIHNLLKC